jgi:hypothetical protein
MIEPRMTIPELILIAGTRVALGIGIGLLLSSRLSREQARAAGLPLVLLGGLTTIPLAMEVFGKGDSRETRLAAEGKRAA